MRKDLTHITLVVDRSFSMQSMQGEAENGINNLIRSQAREEGECTFTLVEFDNIYNIVHNGTNIKNVDRYKLIPRGSTALYDAIGRAITETGNYLSNIKEQDRPNLVIFAIITDGQENSSSEFTLNQIKEMISRQEKEFSWKFEFLGVGVAGFQGTSMGISVSVNYNQVKTAAVYENMSEKFASMRTRSYNGADACDIDNTYTTDQIQSMT